MPKITCIQYYDNELDRQDALTDYAILGFKVVNDDVFPRHRGKLWLYLLFALPTFGVGALCYFIYCRIRMTNGIRLKLSRQSNHGAGIEVPDWVRAAYEKYRAQGVDEYQ